MKKSLLGLALCISSTCFANSVDLFTFKKSFREGNVLHFAVNLNADCTLTNFEDGQLVKPYWIMGEEDGHREGLTTKEVKYYKPVIKYTNAQKTEVDFTLGVLEEVKDLLKDTTLRVLATKSDKGSCEVKTLINMDNVDINLKEVYANGKFTITMSWKTNYMTITGLNPDGSKYSKKIVPKE